MDETELVTDVVRVFEGVGVLILIVGAVYVAARALVDLAARRPVYEATRKRFARSLLLGLEVLVAADVIQTVAVENTLRSVATLGVLVLVRTVLSFSLDIEIDGVVPWRKRQVDAEERAGEAPA